MVEWTVSNKDSAVFISLQVMVYIYIYIYNLEKIWTIVKHLNTLWE